MLIRYAGGEQEELSREDLASKFASFCGGSFDIRTDIHHEFYIKPHKVDPWTVFFKASPTPTDFRVNVHFCKWVVLELYPSNREKHEWMFFHQPEKDFPYEWVPIPPECEIESDGAIVISTDKGDKVRIASGLKLAYYDNDNGWPRVLLNPKAWLALGELRKIVEQGQTKNLTMLSQSNHQPCRGVAIQLKGEILEAIRILTLALL